MPAYDQNVPGKQLAALNTLADNGATVVPPLTLTVQTLAAVGDQVP